MPIVVQHINLKDFGHRAVVFATFVPTWFEKWLLFKRRRAKVFVGAGSKWYDESTNKTRVKGKPLPAYMAVQLQQQVDLFILKGRKNYFNPNRNGK